MKQPPNFTQTHHNYSFQYTFNLVFRKIESGLFVLLCLALLISSKINSNFSNKISFAFVSISIPIAKTAAFPFNSVISLLTNFHQLAEAKKENKKLKEELDNLKKFYIESLYTYQENKELRDVLNFVSTKTSSFKVMKIIGRSHQLFNQKLFVDAGKNRNLKEGDVVVGNKSAIGRIAEIGENKSQLLLLNDATSRIPVIASQSRSRGILAGDSGGLMEILYLPKDHGISEGEMIFTSGDGDTLPPGLLIGIVKKVDKSGKVTVAMVENINNLNMVTVIEY